MQCIDLGLPVASESFSEIEDEQGVESFILAGRSPSEGTKGNEGRIQMDGIDEIARLIP